MLRTTVVLYAFSTPQHLWNCTVNYTFLLLCYSSKLIPLYATRPLVLYCELYATSINATPLRLYTTLSCYIFLYAFSAVCFICLYACTNRNLTTAKLDVCTVLHHAFLLCYIFNCTVPLRRNPTGNANRYTTGTRTRTERVKNRYRMDIEQIWNSNGSEKGKKCSGTQTIRECVL